MVVQKKKLHTKGLCMTYEMGGVHQYFDACAVYRILRSSLCRI